MANQELRDKDDESQKVISEMKGESLEVRGDFEEKEIRILSLLQQDEDKAEPTTSVVTDTSDVVAQLKEPMGLLTILMELSTILIGLLTEL
eukprot:CAMPEP_0185759174 /NCGR_PEP_ID=MMETSP1174-20130828/17883_1 /TAXON_ID=35687 /ORGANISM="Dictyocha speculum, Strain CCMP1381" /LENGTH=90 /DNA_ID=CAMNT_0028439373 /DNA_START=761 /DNA_END=1031 /DNA_ORIENTATION=-